MKTRKWPSLLSMAIAIFCFSSCQDWGEWDDPSGNQKNPPAPDTSVKVLAEYTFEEETGGETFVYENGAEPEILEDENREGNVLHLDGGYVRYANPLKDVEVVNGASITMWVNMPSTDINGALFSFIDDAGSLFFTGNASLSYSGTGGKININDPESVKIGAISAGQWHFLAVTFREDGFTIYIDGKKTFDENNHLGISHSTRAGFDYENIVNFLTSASYFYLGYGSETETKKVYIDDVKIYANLISDKDAMPEGMVESDPEPVYLNTFDEAHTAQIIGSGTFTPITDFGFGTVFKNTTGGRRQNYLLLPDDVLSHSAGTKEMTIGFWVNASEAGTSGDYMWAPLFTAYGSAPANDANGMPMFALQYRGLAQINNNGWCDFTDAQNVAGSNTLYHDAKDWLADKKWHYYTATFTESSVKIYFDGEIANEWVIDGSDGGGSISGLFTNGSDLKYITLGGNQAWDWGDNDPGFMFDDFAVYNKILSQEQIKKILLEKKIGKPVYKNVFDTGNDATIIGGGTFTSADSDRFGIVFKNVASSSPRQNYLLLPDDVLSHSAETKELSIGVWVNATHAGASNSYMWAPLFMAYGAAPVDNANTWPMMALQYRGLVQVNCAGYCDFEDAQNVKGANTLYHDATDWLADKEWHYYTATLTETSVKVYFDGVIANEWVLDPSADNQKIGGLFTNGADLKYICLGGNQAWTWGDNDPGFMFDDIVIYNRVLTAEQIALIISNK